MFQPFERSSYICLPQFFSLQWNPTNALCFGFRQALAALPLVGLVARPKGGLLSSPQNFNLVCLRCFAAGAEEPKPRLNMRDKRAANRLNLARGGEMKKRPTNTVPFFPWIGDLVNCRVKRQVNNGVIQSYENVPVWMFSLGGWAVVINGRWLLTFSVCSPDCAIFLFCFVLGCRLKPNIHRNYIMWDHVRARFLIWLGFRVLGLNAV